MLLGKVTDISTLAFDQPIDLGIKLDSEASDAELLKSYNVVGGGAVAIPPNPAPMMTVFSRSEDASPAFPKCSCQ